MDYSRQTALQEIPDGFQDKVKDKKILIVGCGGVGSALAPLLVRGGFRNIVLVDNDVIDTTNIQRQTYNSSDVGLPKASTLKENLLKIDPYASIQSHVKLVDEKFLRNLGSVDLIIDATDNFATRRIINSYCEENKVDWFYSGAVKTEFSVCLFTCKDNKFEQVFPKHVKDESCCDVGVLASTTHACACLVYNEILKYFIGNYTPVLLKFNLWKYTVHTISL